MRTALAVAGDPQPLDSAELIGRWKDYLRANGRAENTVRTYANAVAQFLAATGRPLVVVTPEDVFGFLAELRNQSSARASYSYGLKSLFGYLAASELIEHDPTALLKPKSPKAPPPTAYSEEETVRLIIAAATHSERRAFALLLGFALGARRSELAGIGADDVDLNRAVVRLLGKGDIEREVELGPLALAALEGLRPWRSPFIVGARPGTISWWVEECARECGMPPRKRRSHVAMRATSISYLLANGVPTPVVRDRAGHANIATTDRYAFAFPEDKRRAASLL